MCQAICSRKGIPSTGSNYIVVQLTVQTVHMHSAATITRTFVEWRAFTSSPATIASTVSQLVRNPYDPIHIHISLGKNLVLQFALSIFRCARRISLLKHAQFCVLIHIMKIIQRMHPNFSWNNRRNIEIHRLPEGRKQPSHTKKNDRGWIIVVHRQYPH